MENVYGGSERDNPTRTLYLRPKGEVGICLDVFDATPENEHDYGSRQFCIMDLTEKLLQHFLLLPLEELQYLFEKQELLEGVTMRSFHRGIILSVAVESATALAELGSLHDSGRLGDILAGHLIPQALMTSLRFKHIKLRTRLWSDEIQACREEIIKGDIAIDSSHEKENANALLTRLRSYQKELPEKIFAQKEKRITFENNLSEFMFVVKQGTSNKIQQITSNEQLEECISSMADLSGSKRRSVQNYQEFNNSCADFIREMQKEILSRLLLIHSSLETANQRNLKVRMRKLLRVALKSRKAGFQLDSVIHTEWNSKTTPRERKLLMGVLSQLSMLDNTVMEADEILDEYMSGWPRNATK